jgi:hypothetical protein
VTFPPSNEPAFGARIQTVVASRRRVSDAARSKVDPEENVSNLHEAEVERPRGKKIPKICKQIRVTELAFYMKPFSSSGAIKSSSSQFIRRRRAPFLDFDWQFDCTPVDKNSRAIGRILRICGQAFRVRAQVWSDRRITIPS